MKIKWLVLLSGLAVLIGASWLYLYPRPLPAPVAGAREVRDSFQTQRRRYRVEAGARIRTVIAGRVTHIGPVDGAGGRALNLIIHNPVTAETVSYLLPDNAQVRVRLGQWLRPGAVVALTQAGGRNLRCLGEANLSLTYLKKGRIVPVGEGSRW